MCSQTRAGSNKEHIARVRSILQSRGLTLYQASKKSATLFGRSSPYYLPHNLYYDLRSDSFSPSLFQLFALSRISEYRLTDWLRVFGFDVEAIPRLQIQLSAGRTVLLDSSLDDPSAFIAWLRNARGSAPSAGVVPLSKVLEWTEPRHLGSLRKLYGKGFLYAKIGYQDALAFPELLPGSIVRVIPGASDDLLRGVSSDGSRKLFLIEHGKGLCCGRMRVIGNRRIAPVSIQLPYAQVEFKVPEEARFVGVVDLEIRNLVKPQQPGIAKDSARHWRPEVLSTEPSQLGSLLRSARLRTGISFRAASAASREVARLLGDERYYLSSGSLSDYEALNTPPRHFHKIMSFCVVYSLRLNVVLVSLGIRMEEAGTDPIPDRLVGRPPSAGTDVVPATDELARTGFLGELVQALGEIPFFLRGSLRELSGLTRPSLKDFFWIDGVRNGFHPYLAGGLLAVVNRQAKKPNDCESRPLWQQPLYVILKRDGTYLCGCCSRENHSLVVHSYPGGVHTRDQFRNYDAEVIGKIAAIVRRLI